MADMTLLAFTTGGQPFQLPIAAAEAIWLVIHHRRQLQNFNDNSLCTYLRKKFPTQCGSVNVSKLEEWKNRLGSSNENEQIHQKIIRLNKDDVARKKKKMNDDIG